MLDGLVNYKNEGIKLPGKIQVNTYIGKYFKGRKQKTKTINN
jgi:hypothetical protein